MFSDYIADDLKANAAVVDPAKTSPPCGDLYQDERRVAFRNAVVAAMDEAGVTAMVSAINPHPANLLVKGHRTRTARTNSMAPET